MEPTATSPPTRHPFSARLLLAGALVTGLVAFAGNALLRVAGAAVTAAPAGFEPFEWTAIAAASLAPAFVAALALGFLSRLVLRPTRLYRWLGYPFLLLSLGGPIGLLSDAASGATAGSVAILLGMHLWTGLVLLEGLARWVLAPAAGWRANGREDLASAHSP